MIWKEFLTQEGHDQEGFDAMDSAEQAKLFASYNEACNKEINDKVELKASKQELDTLKSEIESKQDEAIKTMKENAQLQVKIDKVSSETAKLKSIIKAQGEKLKEKRKTQMVGQQQLGDFEEKFKEASKGITENSNNSMQFTFKAGEVNTFTVGNVAAGVYGANPIAQNATDDMLLAGSYRVPGVFEAPRRKITFLDLLTNRRPIESGMMHALVENSVTGAAALVTETGIKPYAHVDYKLEKVGCVTIPILWKESKKWRTNFSYLLPIVRQKMQTLVLEELEDYVYGQITGTPFTPQTGLEYQFPKKMEVIASAIYSQKEMNFETDVVLVNAIDYATMAYSKSASDQHYDQFNNGSIRIINGNQIVTPSGAINLRISKKVNPGEFFVGDMSKLQYGIENEMEYSQNVGTEEFERNLVNNRLEVDVAVMIPSVFAGAFIKDTYANVIPQITE